MALQPGHKQRLADGEHTTANPLYELQPKMAHVSFDVQVGQEFRSESKTFGAPERKRATSMLVASSLDHMNPSNSHAGQRLGLAQRLLAKDRALEGDSVSESSTPRSVHSVSSAPGMDVMRKAQTDSLLKGIVKKLKGNQGQHYIGRRDSAAGRCCCAMLTF